MSSSDVIIVGAGMAGLVAAARTIERGHRVVVLERTDQAGGYFGGFENEAGDRFDLAVSHLLGGREGESLATLLASLELSTTIQLEPVEIADVMNIQGRRIEMPTGLDRLEAELGKEFPDSVNDLARFFGFMRSFLGDGLEPARERGRFIMRNHRRGFEDFCRETIADPVLRNALAMRIQCDESSLMIMAGFITECYGKGMVYPHGGVRGLVDAVVERIRALGGEIVFGTSVEDFIVEDGRAVGVVLADGTVRHADVVLFNGDAPTLGRILETHGVSGIEGEGRRRGHSSLSVFHTLIDADLSRFGRAARHYVTDTDDVFDTYRVLETGALPNNPVIKLHLMSRIDPSLAAPGRDLIRIEVDMYHEPGEHDAAFYAAYADRIEATVAEHLLQELRTHSVYRRVVTPIDYTERFGHTGGSATGWAHDVHNYMVRRISQRTSLENLFIVGQWGEYGSGLPQLVASAERSVSLTEQWLRKRAKA
jgi:phytoene desaturase